MFFRGWTSKILLRPQTAFVLIAYKEPGSTLESGGISSLNQPFLQPCYCKLPCTCRLLCHFFLIFFLVCCVCVFVCVWCLYSRVHECLLLCVHVCRCVYVYVWRPEVNVGCLPWSLSILYTEAGSLTARNPVSVQDPSLSPAPGITEGLPHSLTFTWVLGFWTQGLMLA